MRNYLLLKYLKSSLKEYIFIFLTSIILSFISLTASFSEESVFTINEVKVKGGINVNFSREKYLNRAFSNSFNILMNKILLTGDLKKVEEAKLKEVKNLITSFQILEESYREDIYRAKIKIVYSEKKVKKFLRKKIYHFPYQKIFQQFFFLYFISMEKSKV